MFFDPNSLEVNVIVTVMVIIMVFLIPWLDKYICNKLGISLYEGIDINPDSHKILVWRKIILVMVFIVYLFCVAYVTFLSRGEAESYSINSSPFLEGFNNSFYIDCGLLDIINILLTQGPSAALEHIKVISSEGITQLYMNIAMLIPMGYLLPYVFDWFRADVNKRTIPACFLTSVMIENVQLLTRHGMYDLDDIFANTLGGAIGAVLFISVAYINTHPQWRSERKAFQKWKRKAKNTAVFPYRDNVSILRSVVYTKDPDVLKPFLEDVLGFQPVYENTEGQSLLYVCGSMQIIVIILDKDAEMPPQRIMLGANHSDLIRKSLVKQGIEVSDYGTDSATFRRWFEVKSPEGLTFRIMEI